MRPGPASNDQSATSAASAIAGESRLIGGSGVGAAGVPGATDGVAGDTDGDGADSDGVAGDALAAGDGEAGGAEALAGGVGSATMPAAIHPANQSGPVSIDSAFPVARSTAVAPGLPLSANVVGSDAAI